MTKRIIIGVGLSLMLIVVFLLSFGRNLADITFSKVGRKETATELSSPFSEPSAEPRERDEVKPESVSTSGTNSIQSNTDKFSNMVWIPGGKFMMGSTERVHDENDHPEHTVILDGFFMDTTEVTQTEYARVMGKNPSHFKGCPDCPVENVTWDDAMAYCKKVGKRLPTEAEWEYACRAGSMAINYLDNDKNAWYEDNSEQKTHPVGQKKPNGLGLYDMFGNVWEWCSDWYDSTYYGKSPSHNPQGPDSGMHRIFRGGSWISNGAILHCALRDWGVPDRGDNLMGFRCVCPR